jgi:hypothetical protein
MTSILVDAAQAEGSENKRTKPSIMSYKMGGSSAVSGMFTGALRGEIRISGKKVLITKNTTVFTAGSGLVKGNARVVNKAVYATGTMKQGVLVAKIVVINGERSTGNAVPLTEAFSRPKKGETAN